MSDDQSLPFNRVQPWELPSADALLAEQRWPIPLGRLEREAEQRGIRSIVLNEALRRAAIVRHCDGSSTLLAPRGVL